MSEGQLHLFGEPADSVKPALDSPLATERVEESLKRLPGLFLGTSSWSFPGWRGLVYQETHHSGTLAQHGLRAYSRLPLFRTVSLDRTYYRPMQEEEYRTLARQVPPGFRFIVKAPRDLLQAGAGGIDLARFSSDFLTPARQGLGDTLGIVLLQFPPGTLSEQSQDFLPALRRFVMGLPQGIAFSMEFRDDTVLGPPLREVLQGSNVSLCASIHSSLPNPDQQLLKVPPNPGTPLLFRWNLRPSLGYEQARGLFEPFDRLQSEDPVRRALLAQLVNRALAAGRTVYLTANNKSEGCAPLSILRLLEKIEELFSPKA